MILGFTVSGWRLAAKNIGSYKEPKYKYQATSIKTGEIKDLDANQYGQALNTFKKSRRK